MLIRISEYKIINTAHMVALEGGFEMGDNGVAEMDFIDGSSVVLNQEQYDYILSLLKVRDITCNSSTNSKAAE